MSTGGPDGSGSPIGGGRHLAERGRLEPFGRPGVQRLGGKLMRWRAVLYVTVLIVTTLVARGLVDWAKRASKKPPLPITVISRGSPESQSPRLISFPPPPPSKQVPGAVKLGTIEYITIPYKPPPPTPDGYWTGEYIPFVQVKLWFMEGAPTAEERKLFMTAGEALAKLAPKNTEGRRKAFWQSHLDSGCIMVVQRVAKIGNGWHAAVGINRREPNSRQVRPGVKSGNRRTENRPGSPGRVQSSSGDCSRRPSVPSPAASGWVPDRSVGTAGDRPAAGGQRTSSAYNHLPSGRWRTFWRGYTMGSRASGRAGPNKPGA
jgi:hypothetical protein